MAISRTRGADSFKAALAMAVLSYGEEQAETLERARRPQMTPVRDLESCFVECANELVDRETRDAIGAEYLRRLRCPIVADLQEWPADLVELPGNLVYQLEAARCQQGRPLGAFAIQLQEPNP